ncbi:MAG: DUF2079 domain-containing protein, partial [Candidatus Wallbacteria bacterium]|nr:DUF2079 domain-containing protein [Candidatus Wallbacteria bacterium]
MKGRKPVGARPAPSRGPVLALFALVVAFSAVVAWFSLSRYDTFKNHLHDTGLIAQSFWSTTQGRLFVNSVNPEIGRSEYYFGNHFTPIYVLIAPLYWLFATPKTLLLLQAVLLGLGAVPVFGLARVYFESPGAALLFAALYLLHPAVWFAGLYDFHAEAVCGTFLLYAILYLELGMWPQFWVACALAMACKEHVSLVVMMLGLGLMRTPQNRRRGATVAAVGLGVFLITNGVLIPAFAHAASHPYLAERYAHLGTTIPQIAWHAVSHPLEVLGTLCTGRHLYYVLCLLGPLLFLPVLALPALAVGVPTFLANGLSSLIYTYDIGFYHSASILPGLIWATIRASGPLVCRLSKAVPAVGARGWAAVLLANALFWHCQTQSAFLPGLYAPLSPHAY